MHQDVLNSIDLYVGNGGTAVLALSAYEVSVWSDYTYLQTTRLAFFFKTASLPIVPARTVGFSPDDSHVQKQTEAQGKNVSICFHGW